MIDPKNIPRLRILLAALLLWSSAGCAKPRPRDEIFAEKQRLPRLYLSTKSQARIVAPGNKGSFVDPDTKEEFWPALQCTKPDCPGRTGDEPYLFTPLAANVAHDVSGCPACWKKRNLQSESNEQKKTYAQFVKPYELPESRRARERLDEEYVRAAEADEKRKPQ